MELKLVFGILATIITIVGYVPYFRDIFSIKTKPHLYTWLIWGITQGTATLALLKGGGKIGAISLLIGTILVAVIFFLSFKYGTKNITKSDTLALIFALLAILVWWQLDNPILAVLMVSLIDMLGYIPTLRKTFTDPSTETMFFWICMLATDILAMLANSEYNLLTMSYLTALAVCNSAMILVIWFRRKH